MGTLSVSSLGAGVPDSLLSDRDTFPSLVFPSVKSRQRRSGPLLRVEPVKTVGHLLCWGVAGWRTPALLVYGVILRACQARPGG